MTGIFDKDNVHENHHNLRSPTLPLVDCCDIVDTKGSECSLPSIQCRPQLEHTK